MEETLIDCLLEDLGQILSIGTNLNLEETVPIKFLCEDLKFIKDFLRDYKEKCNEDEELKILVTYIRDAASKALVDLDLFTVVSFMYDDDEVTTPFHDVFDHSLKLRDMILEIKSIKREVLEIYDKKSYGTAVPQAGSSSTSKVLEDYDKFSGHSVQEVETSTTRSRSTVSRECKSIVEEETVVGFEDDAMVIIERLTGVQRQLDVIPIVGMAGLGKTTIARKVYNDPLIAYHFYIRGWIYVSQEYNIRDLLLGLLSYFVKSKNKILLMSEEEKFGVEKLGEELYRCLKGMRYLIVLDDIWNLLAWNDIKIYLPNDNNGSRVLLTTRLENVALGMKPCKPPHRLRFLTKAESWDLLKQKTFGGDCCPLKLRYIGKKIAESCEGLPLGIVVAAGLLAKERKTRKLWNKFAKRVRENIVGDTKNFMDILEMSYSNLPYHLQMCFTFFGAFKIHHEIPVWKLICFWIARGFIPQIGEESLEDVAEGYLMDLIDRSLVIPAKKSSDGKTKACRIQDTLHDLCLRKATELQLPIYQHGRVTSSSGSISFNYPCFLSHDAPDILGMPSVELDHFLSLDTTGWNAHRILKKVSIYKHLRVFDLWDITLKEFPVVVSQLVHLRYLALQVYFIESLPTFISNLRNLETLILRKRAGGKVTLPHLWRMQKLRHLRISAPLEFENPCCNWWYYLLNDLQTISTLCLSSLSKDVLEMTPNLRKLGLFTPLSDSRNFAFPDLAHLVHLRTLKLEDWRLNPLPSSIPQMGTWHFKFTLLRAYQHSYPISGTWKLLFSVKGQEAK